MFGRTASRIAIASVSALLAGGALAVPASAQIGLPIGPHQHFYGRVFGPVTGTALNVIDVLCAGPLATGRPAPGQSVDVELLLPPGGATAGYTGNSANQIDADLIWSRGTVTTVTFVGTLTRYDVKVAIPTSITVPCAGSGVMSFTPSPDPDNSGSPSNVNVTFQSAGF
jgi:hypothetical protein